jgi:hypothetical protein
MNTSSGTGAVVGRASELKDETLVGAAPAITNSKRLSAVLADQPPKKRVDCDETMGVPASKNFEFVIADFTVTRSIYQYSKPRHIFTSLSRHETIEVLLVALPIALHCGHHHHHILLASHWQPVSGHAFHRHCDQSPPRSWAPLPLSIHKIQKHLELPSEKAFSARSVSLLFISGISLSILNFYRH